jgi:stage IV sporulation protein FB
MLLYEPPPTQADVHFRLFGFPVRVSPWFWIVALLFGVSGGPADPIETLLWVSVILVSVLVHELGHAFMQQHYGGHPRITLHGFGGLTICEDCDRSPGRQIVVSLAGPLAGFCLAGLVILILIVSGHFERFRPSMLPVQWMPYDIGQPGKLSLRDELILMLLVVNIFWGAITLLPIYPLDGGRVAREVFTLGNARRGIVASLWLSVFAAGGVAAYALWQRWFVMVLLFGYLAYLSYRTIRAYEQQLRGGI